MLVARLPGFPDGITSSASRGSWIGIAAPELRIIKYLRNR